MLPALLSALAQLGFSAIASAVASKGKEVIEEKLGVDLSEAIETPEGRLHLKQLEVQHEQFLVDAAIRREQQGLEELKTGMADVANARARDLGLRQAGDVNNRANYLAVLTVVGVICVVAAAVFIPNLGEFAKTTLAMVAGALLKQMDAVFSFEFGTTRGSRAKDETIRTLAAGPGNG